MPAKVPTLTGGAIRGVRGLSRMGVTRLVVGALGLALGLFGVYRLLTQIPNQDLVWLVEWLVAAIILHDFILSPILVGIGVALRRLPARGRRYVQGALIAGGVITSIGILFVINVNTGLLDTKFNRPGSGAKQSSTVKKAKALLEQNYAANLLVLLAIVVVVALALYGLRVYRERRDGRGPRDAIAAAPSALTSEGTDHGPH